MFKFRYLIILLTLLTLLPARADVFTYTYEGNTLSYSVIRSTYNSYEVEVSKGTDGNVVIPSSFCIGLSSFSVTSIGSNAFRDCSELLSVSIPYSVTKIGNGAFLGCSKLKEILISSNNKEYQLIDGVLFSKDATEIILYPAGKAGTHYEIPNSVTTIREYAFYGCSELVSVTIPNSVTKIGNSAFSGCSSLTDITIPSSVTELGWDAFSGCTSLASVTIPESVTYIGESAFKGCTSLTSVTIPESVTNIGWYAFMGCTALTSVTIPESVTSIGDGVFQGCTSLASVTIPESVTYIGWNAFEGCTSLNSVTIPESVTNIGESAFAGCTALTSVTIPVSVTNIGESAFKGCTALTSVTIPESVINIERNAFQYCSALANITFNGDTFNRINPLTFNNCTALTSLYITCSESDFNTNLFNNLKSIKSLTVTGDNNTLTREVFQYFPYDSLTIVGNGTTIEDWAFEKSNLRSLTITGQSTIGNSAFKGCESIETVTITGQSTIGNGAFKGCESIETVTITGQSTIGNGAFQGCEYIETVTISGHDSSIGESAFRECSSLRYINIDSVTEIGAYAFSECSSLETVVIPERVSEIATRAFYGCSKLKSVTIPDGVLGIGEYAFADCSSLNHIIIPPSVKSIDENAFYGYGRDFYFLKKVAYPNNLSDHFGKLSGGCPYIADNVLIEDGVIFSNNKDVIYYVSPTFKGEFVLPEQCVKIGQYAFVSCDSITSIIVPQEDPYTIIFEDNSFNGIYQKLLIVPDGSIRKYCLSQWSLFEIIKGYNSEMPCTRISDDILTYILNPLDKTAIVTGYKSNTEFIIPERVTLNPDSDNPERYTVKAIGYGALKDLKTVTFHNRSSIEEIGEDAFANSKITSIDLPETVNYIGACAFYGCSNLTSFTFPDKVNEINTGTFYGCSSLSNIEIPDKTPSIGDYAFYGCKKLKSIKIPDITTYIGKAGFYDCTSLTDVKLGENLETIGAYAFAISDDNSYLYGSLSIPASIKTIGEEAFRYRYLNTVTINDLYAWCNIDFGSRNSNPCVLQIRGVMLNGAELTNLEIPEGITEIKPYTFAIRGEVNTRGAYYNVNGRLKSVKFPSTLQRIGVNSFFENGFTEIVIPPSVTYIDKASFVTGNYQVGTISGDFYITELAGKLVIEEGITPIEIADNAFGTEMIADQTRIVSLNPYSEVYCGRYMESVPMDFKKIATDVTIGNCVTEIPDSLWTGGNIKNLRLGNGIKTIGIDAFKDNKLAAELVLPPSLEVLGDRAFASNSGVSVIKMGENVTSIGEKAFDGCAADNIFITAPTPPQAPNNVFNKYTGNLYVQGSEAIDAYYDAWTCWDRFEGKEMTVATEIEGESEDVSGMPGKQFKLTATVIPQDVDLPYIFWHSTDPAVATVDTDGVVTLCDETNMEKSNSCKIIAETLYANGPRLEVSVTNDGISGIETVNCDNGATTIAGAPGIYNLQGICLSREATEDEINRLSPGLYIINGKKTIIRK